MASIMTEKQRKILKSEPNLKKERIHRILERVCSKVTGPFLPLKRPEATNSLASHPLIRYQSIASFRQISQDSSQTLLGGERRCECWVSCPKTQHNYSAWARSRTTWSEYQQSIHNFIHPLLNWCGSSRVSSHDLEVDQVTWVCSISLISFY